MDAKQLFYELQKRFELILDGRLEREMLTRLLQAAHLYAMEVVQELSKELTTALSRPLIVCTDQETVNRLLEEQKKKEG